MLLSGETEKILFCQPIKDGDILFFDFVNSIYGAPVREILQYDGSEGLFLIGVESPSYGLFEYYGLIPDEKNKATLRRKVGSIRIRSSDYENHILSLNGISTRLKDLIPDGEVLILKTEKNRACR